MSFGWLSVAIAAQAIIGSSAILDKLLLRKRSIEPRSYTFWFGMLGLAAALLLPFGFARAEPAVIALALLAGALFIASAFFYFWTLESLEASEALPLIGALSPVFTLFLAGQILGTDLGIFEAVGFIFFIGSGLILFLIERREIGMRHLAGIAVSAFLLAGSHVVSKLVFLETNFITGFFWIKIGGVLLASGMLLSPTVRKNVVLSEHADARSKFFYLLNRAYASVGSLLVSFAIFLSSPPLVDATQNIRFAVIFILAWAVLRERFRGKILIGKIIATVAIAGGLGWFAVAEYARSLPPVNPSRPISWGVTFSAKFSRELGLDWKETYLEILDDLKPSLLRIPAYWDESEPAKGEFQFADLDWQISEAGRHGVPVVLAIGFRLPRWPECHAPSWARDLGADEREANVREYVARVVERYAGDGTIRMWQIENEPYLFFGECPARGERFLEQEVRVVKEKDPSRPVLTTDGGEMGLWVPTARHGDVFGTTMYRKVYPRIIGPIFGEVEYPLNASYFRIKERLTRWIVGKRDLPVIVVELQGEPWKTRSLVSYEPSELAESFSPDYFRDTVEYAKESGFESYYLWGAEWWFWMKERGDARYWEIAGELFRSSAH